MEGDVYALLLTAGRFHLRYAQVQAQEEQKIFVLLVPVCVVGVTTVCLCLCSRCGVLTYGCMFVLVLMSR